MMKASKNAGLDKPMIVWRILATSVVIAIGVGLLGLLSNGAHAAADSQDAPNVGATVNFAHYAPFGFSQAVTTVNVSIDDVQVLSNFSFGDVKTGLALSSGEHRIIIKLAATDTTALRAKINLAEGGSYTIMAIGDGVNQPIDLRVLDDSTAVPTEGTGKLRVGHLAPFAADIEATRVDICTDSGIPIPPLLGIPYGLVSGFLELPAGDYDLIVAVAGSNCAVVAFDIPALRLGSGDILDAYAIGKNDASFPLSISNILGVEVTPATVNVAHYAPFGNSLEGTSVGVFVDDVEASPNFKFGDVVTGLVLAPGKHLVEIKLTATGMTAFSATIDLADGGSYTIMAIGDGVNQPIDLRVLDDSTAVPTEGTGKLRVGHLAPFAANIEATKVDICTDGGIPIPPLLGIPYGLVSGFLELPAGDYDLIVAVAGSNCAVVAFDIPALRLGSGDILDAYAIGKNDASFPLSISNILGVEVTPATVNVAHYAPFGNSLEGTSVGVFVDDVEASPNFKFGDVVTGLVLAPGKHLVEIKLTATGMTAFSATIDLADGGSYTIMAIGDGVNQPIDLRVLDDSTAVPTEGTGKLRVGHLAPFAANIEATKVDICTDGGIPIPPLLGIPYGLVSGFLELPAGDYDLMVTVAGSNCATVALDLPAFQLHSGEIADAYAIGNASETFPVQIGTLTGLKTMKIYLPKITQ